MKTLVLFEFGMLLRSQIPTKPVYELLWLVLTATNPQRQRPMHTYW